MHVNINSHTTYKMRFRKLIKIIASTAYIVLVKSFLNFNTLKLSIRILKGKKVFHQNQDKRNPHHKQPQHQL
jgi:tmRNA-binding protein